MVLRPLAVQGTTMDEPGVPPTFAVGLTRALIIGYIAFRLEQSLIIGCLIAGAMVGLCTPYAVINRTIAGQFTKIGFILLF